MDLYAITIKKTITASNLNLSGDTSLSNAAIKNNIQITAEWNVFAPPTSFVLIFDILQYIIPAKKESR